MLFFASFSIPENENIDICNCLKTSHFQTFHSFAFYGEIEFNSKFHLSFSFGDVTAASFAYFCLIFLFACLQCSSACSVASDASNPGAEGATGGGGDMFGSSPPDLELSTDLRNEMEHILREKFSVCSRRRFVAHEDSRIYCSMLEIRDSRMQYSHYINLLLS